VSDEKLSPKDNEFVRNVTAEWRSLQPDKGESFMSSEREKSEFFRNVTSSWRSLQPKKAKRD
jgi:hypothetical protein